MEKVADRILNYKFSNVPIGITNCAQRQLQHAAEQGRLPVLKGQTFITAGERSVACGGAKHKNSARKGRTKTQNK